MRLARSISAEEENFRIEPAGHHPTKDIRYGIIRRDPVEPEPVGTIILEASIIVGYDRDCDGSLMARIKSTGLTLEELEYDLSHIDKDDYTKRNWGIYPSTSIVITKDELIELCRKLKETA